MYKYFIFFLILFIASCNNEKYTITDSSARDQFYIIWSHSDIQPRKIKDREGYETAVEDIKNNLPKPDIAIVAGDIVHDKNASADFEWFLKTREKAGIAKWFEITGNHDMKDYKSYKKYIGKPRFYSYSQGNILFLFMSDEDRHPPTKISDEAFRWWKKQVIENQDKIIITTTHGYLKHSGLFLADSVESRTILNSERFEEVLKQYRVDLWLSGHTHIPSTFGFNEHREEKFNNTVFINISRIRRDFGFNPESRIIVLKKNSDIMIIKTRDHHKKEYIKNREITIQLPIRAQF